MCLAVYVASNIQLPTSRWDEARPAFYLKEVDQRHKVRRQFTLPHVYYAGSDARCGCGFRKDEEDGEKLERSQANYFALGKCIRDAQTRGAQFELFSCWEGDEKSKPRTVKSASVDQIEERSFEFQEDHFITVVS